MIITIDPNVRGCGVSQWADRLEKAIYVKNPLTTGRGYVVYAALADAVFWKSYSTDLSMIIVEMPRVYPGMPQTDLNDLLDVCGVGAAVATRFNAVAVPKIEIRHVFPSEWKGQVKKRVMLDRIDKKLSHEEALVVQKTNKDDTEDILDSIGIGLWHFGRLNSTKYPGAEP